MVQGQLLESDNGFNFGLKPETYFDIIKNKTSSMFASIAEVVAKIHQDSTDIINNFYEFGTNFGIIFQISDDMLDIFSKNSGKDHFKDLKEGRITLPYILLLKTNKSDLVKNYSDGNQEKLLELFKIENIQNLSQEIIEKYYVQCLEFLDKFPDSIYKKSLVNLLDFIKYREYWQKFWNWNKTENRKFQPNKNHN